MSAVTIGAVFKGRCNCGSCDNQWYEAGTQITWLEHPVGGWAIKSHLEDNTKEPCSKCFTVPSATGACLCEE